MELTIEQALQQGVAAHKEGKVQEAERLYRSILQSQPAHADANHNLGIIAVSVNKVELALPLFKTALEANPKTEQFWLSYIDAFIKEKHFEAAKQVIQQAKKQGIDGEKLNALKAQLENANSSNPSQQQLNSLLEHYQSGRYGEAEKLAVSITEQFPTHPFGWKVLGAVLGQSGRKSEAVNAYQKTVALCPQDTAAHNNLGHTLIKLGRLDEAEASYKQVIALKPDYAEAHNNLGSTLKNLGRLEEAETSYTQAITLKPDYAEAHINLGSLLSQIGRSHEAEVSYRQAVALKSDFYLAHYNLGVTLQELCRLEDAEASYKQAISLKPDYAEAHSNLGATLQELGRLEEAEASYTQAIALKPDYTEAHSNLGTTLQELGRLEEAEANYTQAIALKPDYAIAHNNLGATLQELGRLEEAEASYTQAIALKPDYGCAHRHLSMMKKFESQDVQYLKMQALYRDENTSEEQRCQINFGLAKACEDLEDFEQAYTHYCEGNVLRKKLLNYDINQDVELFNQIKFNYPRISQNLLEPDNLANNPTPIFIVGMTRSGTTLVEQIISSHPQVMGAGELPFVVQYGETMAIGYADISTKSLIDFRNKYRTKLQGISKGNLIVTDKMPQNFRYIGLIAAAFPEARIVHVKRNPAAVCWANYKQYFASKKLGYCYALDDVIRYYRLYENLMEFWENTLSKRIYNLDYELLTVNQENETHRLIDYLGLGWDEKCLSPQDNTRSVATASNLQVRKKVYQNSSQQWKKYEPFLNGALDELLAT